MAFQASSDAVLIERVRAGDAASYDELYRRHLDDTRRLARLVTWSNEAAEEITAEAFTRVLARLRAGGGPSDDFAPYLRTVVRRLAVDYRRSARHEVSVPGPDVMETIPEPDDEINIAATRTMVRQAYETLPPRWQQVLWHTEVEGAPPATLADAFDSTPNGVAALAYRAREGLRRAYFTLHLAHEVRAECKAYIPKLAALSRGSLDAGEQRAVGAHLAECTACHERYDDMMLLVSDMRAALTPALLGVAAGSGGAGAGAGAAAAPGAAGDGAGKGGRRPRRPSPRTTALAGTVAAAVAAVAVAMVATNIGSAPDGTGASPPVAAGSPTSEPGGDSIGSSTPTPAEEISATPSPTAPTSEPTSPVPLSDAEQTRDSAGSATDSSSTDSESQPKSPPQEPSGSEPSEGRTQSPTATSTPTSPPSSSPSPEDPPDENPPEELPDELPDDWRDRYSLYDLLKWLTHDQLCDLLEHAGFCQHWRD